MIKLEDYGALISKQEFVVDLKNKNRLISGLYVGSNNHYDNGFISVEISPNEKKLGYDCKVVSNKGQVKIRTTNVDTLACILSYADSVFDTDRDLPVNVYTYNNSKNKNDEYFFVNIDGIELEIFKENKLIVDNNYYAKEEIKPLVFGSHYEFHDYGIYCNDNNKEKMYLLKHDYTCSPSSEYIDLSNIYTNPSKISAIPNLNNIPSKIAFSNDSEIMFSDSFEYDDKFGIMTKSTNCVYESYYSSENDIDTPIYCASIHPFWFDNFDTEIIPSINRFCIDQINRSLDDDIIIYTREIYDIDENKLEKLVNDIESANMSYEPCIVPVD